eukprot:3543715-Pleurochrysis_carterae.AAC.1
MDDDGDGINGDGRDGMDDDGRDGMDDQGMDDDDDDDGVGADIPKSPEAAPADAPAVTERR